MYSLLDPVSAKIPSTQGASGLDHFVTPNANQALLGPNRSVVVLEAVLDNPFDCPLITWGSSVLPILPGIQGNPCLAAVRRLQSAKVPVWIECDGMRIWEGVVWIISADTTYAGPAPTVASELISGCQSVNYPLGSGTCRRTRTDWDRFEHRIIPAAIITDVDRPALHGANDASPPVPGGANLHAFSNNPLSGGASRKWDATRATRVRIVNPNLLEKGDLVTVQGWIYDSQPLADSTPVDYPGDPVEGNDDASANDEDNDPYSSNVGLLLSRDNPQLTVPNAAGLPGFTYQQDRDYLEFARFQLPTGWYRISWPLAWTFNIRLTYVGGGQPRWVDDGTVTSLGN